jgi:hypothetical protein
MLSGNPVGGSQLSASAGGGSRRAVGGVAARKDGTSGACVAACAVRSCSSTDSSTMCAEASNTSLQWPQRTQPSEIFSWSGTTRNMVPQAGQLVIRLMSPRL